MGQFREDTYGKVQNASLAFCIIGTFLVVAEWYAIKFIPKKATGPVVCGLNRHQIRANVGFFVILFEDIPQLALCGVYLNGMYKEEAGGFSVSKDPLTFLSILLSSFSFLYNLQSAVRQRIKGSAMENDGPEFSSA